jgi:hypothetical protein
LNPRVVSQLPPTIHTAFIDAYAASLQTVFRSAIPIALFAFLLAWLLPEVKLRRTVAPTDRGAEQRPGVAVPEPTAPRVQPVVRPG